MDNKLSDKNTKNEILKAYEDLLKKVTDTKVEEPRKVQEELKKQDVVKQATGLSSESIIRGFATLKLDLASTMDKLEENLVKEFKKLEDVRQAIAIEQENLQQLYLITAQADSLAALLLAQKEKKEQFEQELATKRTLFEERMAADKGALETEIAQKREQWKKEKNATEQATKEDLDEQKKRRQREEEEYAYNLNLARKKDNDQYNERVARLDKDIAEKRAAFDLEINTREAAVSAAERELKDLRELSATFPAKLQTAVDETEAAITKRLATEYRFEKELQAKQTEGELKLKDQIVSTLNAKIKDLENIIKEQTQKATTAEASVKDIAIKAIESSSKLQIVEKSSNA